jgi:hypothetical protein
MNRKIHREEREGCEGRKNQTSKLDSVAFQKGSGY